MTPRGATVFSGAGRAGYTALMPKITGALLAGLATCMAAPALAQRLPFERSFEISEPAVLDVSTVRGKIDVIAGERGRVVVGGDVTVRVSWDVPANALELAQKIAANPPISREGNTLRLRAPADAVERRAVTVSYEIRVPPDTQVIAVSESGATRVHGVAGAVTVRTQSAAIDLGQLGGPAGVTTGSGAVVVDGVAGVLTVTTSSSSFTGRALHGDVRVRTSSGAIDVTLDGPGTADAQTKSSAIRLRGLKGGATAVTESGAISLSGSPAAAWTASTGSGSVEITLDRGARFEVDAVSRSGSVRLEGLQVDGTIAKGRVAGTVAGGGPLVHVRSRSGSVRIGG